MKEDVLMVVMEYCCCSLGDILRYCSEVSITENHIAAVCAASVKGKSLINILEYL